MKKEKIESKSDSGNEMLIVSQIHKSFPAPDGTRLEVLRGVSFSVAAGEMIAITGISGAGKSTLLHVIGALEPSDSGSVKLGDREVTSASSQQLTHYHRREVGFIFQFHHLLADLSAAENVALPLLINRESRREAMRFAGTALDELNLASHATHPISQLSGGEQQRVAVARALVTRPRLILADEPTGNLDSKIGDEIGALLSSYCRTRPAAIIIATHNEQLAQICDRVLNLHDGILMEQGYLSG